MVNKPKYNDFAYHSTENGFLVFLCPHDGCKNPFIKVPEATPMQKSSKCLKHLQYCSSTNSDFDERFQKSSMPKCPSARKIKRTTTSKKATDLVIIYCLVFIPEDRVVYTGRTKDPDRRLAQHARRSSQCRLVRNAFKKHGRKNFCLEVLMRCHPDDAKANESAWIIKNNTLYPRGYNLVHGSTAGDETDVDKQIVPSFCNIVPFNCDIDEANAISESWADIAQVLEEGKVSENADNDNDEQLKGSVALHEFCKDEEARKRMRVALHPDKLQGMSDTTTKAAETIRNSLGL
jgi:hypothetical protein